MSEGRREHDRPLKVVVVGTRGIPDIQGGVETHCEHLYPILASRGVDVTVIRRRPYSEAVATARGLKIWQGVKLIDVFAPKKKSLEAIVHTSLAIFRARALRPDVVHIHAVGPSLMAPLARLLGMRVVMTNHGPDYERDKWGRLAAAVLRLGERWGSKFSNAIISIAPHISEIVKTRYGREAALIPNGVTRPAIPADAPAIVESMGLEPGRYIVALGRFVKEKNFLLLIRSFLRLKAEGAIHPDFKLAIAGDADHPDNYSEAIKALARGKDDVVLTGVIRGAQLASLMSQAALFVMPSSHEGLPIALLEAMSYDLDVAVSDIPACRIPELAPDDFFTLDDEGTGLSRAISRKLAAPATPRRYDLSRYSWPAIADATLAVYRSIL